MLIRQGDVLLIPTTQTGDEDAPSDPRGLVLAEGESSGHHHAVFGRGCKLFNLRNSTDRVLEIGADGGCVRVVGGGAAERHTPVALTPGRYLVRIQRAWTSALASRQVSD